VDVQSGVLNLNGGGNSSGAWTAEDGTTLAFNGGTMALTNGSTLTSVGTGLLTLSATFATVTITGNVTANTFTISGGSLQGTGTFTVNNKLDFTGGGINDPNGTVSIPVGATLLVEGNANKSFSGGTLNLAGTTTWKDSGDFNDGGGTVNNLSGATFTIQNAQTLGSGTFNNSGTLLKTSIGETNVSVFATFNNTGTIDVQAGTLNVASDLVQNAGTTIVESGTTLQVGAFGRSLKLNGGTLTGTGMIVGDVNNAATVRPGGASSAGTLSMTGNYTQTAAGNLVINVGGFTPGSSLSQLAVSGSATLAGVLSLNSVSGFTASLGNSFTVLTYASASGNLAVGGTLSPGAGNQFTTTRGPTSLSVTLTQIPPPPPGGGGGGPGPGPSPTPRPVSASPFTKRIGKRKVLMVHVAYSSGLVSVDVVSPFQQPAYKGIQVSLTNTSLTFTAHKGKRKVTRIVSLP
jgi:hypothetical protein